MFKSEPTKSDALMGVFSVLTSKKQLVREVCSKPQHHHNDDDDDDGIQTSLLNTSPCC